MYDNNDPQTGDIDERSASTADPQTADEVTADVSEQSDTQSETATVEPANGNNENSATA
jgi:hypothetical protein